MSGSPLNPCPRDLGERLDMHARYVQSLNSSVRMGRRLELESVDLGMVRFQNRDLRRAVLKRCRMSCGDLRGLRAAEGEFLGADLSASDLSDADFTRAQMRGVDLSRAILNRTRFDGADLSPFDSRNETNDPQKTVMGRISGRGASFVGAVLDHASFEEANLQDANFTYAKLRAVSLKKADLRGADFSMADVPEALAATIAEAGGKLQKALVPDAVFAALADHKKWLASDGRAGARADFSSTNLAGLNLDGSDFSGVVLARANLSRTSLRGSRLVCADLRGANLSEVDMTGADLRGALLDQAFAVPEGAEQAARVTSLGR